MIEILLAITGVIGTIGGVIGILVSYLTNRRLIESRMEELKSEEKRAAFEKRMKYITDFYVPLSDKIEGLVDSIIPLYRLYTHSSGEKEIHDRMKTFLASAMELCEFIDENRSAGYFFLPIKDWKKSIDLREEASRFLEYRTKDILTTNKIPQKSFLRKLEELRWNSMELVEELLKVKELLGLTDDIKKEIEEYRHYQADKIFGEALARRLTRNGPLILSPEVLEEIKNKIKDNSSSL